MPQANSTTSRPARDLAERVGEHLAVLGGDDRRELLLAGVEQLAEGEQHLGAPGQRRVRATPRRPPGGRDGLVDVGGRREVDACRDTAGRRVEDVALPGGDAAVRLAPDPVRDVLELTGRAEVEVVMPWSLAGRPADVQQQGAGVRLPSLTQCRSDRRRARAVKAPQESKPRPSRSRVRSQRLRRPSPAVGLVERPAGQLDAGPPQRLRRERDRLAAHDSRVGCRSVRAAVEQVEHAPAAPNRVAPTPRPV